MAPGRARTIYFDDGRVALRTFSWEARQAQDLGGADAAQTLQLTVQDFTYILGDRPRTCTALRTTTAVL